MPPPTPISPKMQMKSSNPRAAPLQCSASAARFASFSACTGNPSRSRSSAATGTSDQPRFGATTKEPEPPSTRPGTAVIAVHAPLDLDVAGQALDDHREIVDVHLKPDSDDDGTELERHGRTSYPAGKVGITRLVQQVELDQIRDE